MKFLIAAGTFAMLAGPAAAAPFESVYTDLILDQCQMDPVDEETDSASWWCGGYDRIPVRVREGDLRFFVSYGDLADNEIASSETLPQFNTIGERIEWRLDDGVAFATILRWHIDSDNGTSSFLIVTKLGSADGICHVASIDAVQNPNANALARQIADERAQTFRCGIDEVLAY